MHEQPTGLDNIALARATQMEGVQDASPQRTRVDEGVAIDGPRGSPLEVLPNKDSVAHNLKSNTSPSIRKWKCQARVVGIKPTKAFYVSP